MERNFINENEDLTEVQSAVREIVELMDAAEPKDDSDEEWERYFSTPLTISYGDRTIVLPTCAQTYNAMCDFIENLVF